MKQASTGVAVGVGGIAGAALRWGLAELVADRAGWPVATLIANVLGCAALGYLVGRFGVWTTPLLVGGATGFCGALTTFSSFAVELAVYLRDDQVLEACGYLGGSLVLGGAALMAGHRVGGAAAAPGAVAR